MVATDCKKNDWVERLGKHLVEQDYAYIEVEDEAGHGECPASRWEVAMHGIRKVTIISCNTKLQVLGCEGEAARNRR